MKTANCQRYKIECLQENKWCVSFIADDKFEYKIDRKGPDKNTTNISKSYEYFIIFSIFHDKLWKDIFSHNLLSRSFPGMSTEHFPVRFSYFRPASYGESLINPFIMNIINEFLIGLGALFIRLFPAKPFFFPTTSRFNRSSHHNTYCCFAFQIWTTRS